MNKKKYEIDAMRRWTREELGAIVGPPVDVLPVVAAALIGCTTAQIRSMARREDLLAGTDEHGHLQIPTYRLMRRLGPASDNPPLMLRAGALVARPGLPAMDLARRFPTGELTIQEVVTITGQTAEEVQCDLLARRLQAQRGFRPRWRIFADQFGADYNDFKGHSF